MPAPFGVDDAETRAALDAYVKLLRAGRSVLGRVEPRLAAAGLTPTQFGVLEAILHLGPLSQRELTRKVLTSPGNMTDLVDKLEARGLARRSRRRADRRAVQVELTPAGRALIEPLFVHHAADITAAMSGLNPDELRQLGALLARLGLAAEAPLETGQAAP
jgi:MarR family transcriptional regulator, 2-MHQ and catechol-resistance regulon repressor